MAWKVVLKVVSMIDDETKQKAIEAAADIYGYLPRVESIAADLIGQILTVVGDMDAEVVVKKLKNVAGIVDIVSVGPSVSPTEPSLVPKKKKTKKKKKQCKKVEEKQKRQEKIDDGEEND